MAQGTVRSPGTKMPTQQVVVVATPSVTYDNLKTDPPPTIPRMTGG